MKDPREYFAKPKSKYISISIGTGHSGKQYSQRSISFNATQRKFDGYEFLDCHFGDKEISQMTFIGCRFVNCEFYGVRFKEIEFHDCVFVDSLLNKVKFFDVYIDPNSFQFNKLWKFHAANINAYMFQALYRNMKEIFQDKFAEIADKRFRIFQRWYWITKKKKSTRDWITTWIKITRDFTYRAITGYGYNISNALISTFSFGVLALFVLNYFWREMCVGGVVGKVVEDVSYWEKIYFLIVTATTLGYGDMSPKSIFGMISVSIFLLLAVLWTATVTAIFVKRIAK